MCLTPLRITAKATPGIHTEQCFISYIMIYFFPKCKIYENNVHININLISSLTWEDVSIVPLSRSEDATIFQGYWVEWTATGKKTSTLLDKETKSVRGTMADGKKERTTGRVVWLDRNS